MMEGMWAHRTMRTVKGFSQHHRQQSACSESYVQS